jgi:hypothetical protein
MHYFSGYTGALPWCLASAKGPVTNMDTAVKCDACKAALKSFRLYFPMETRR